MNNPNYAAAQPGKTRPAILFVDQFWELGGGQYALLDLLTGVEQSYVPVVALPGPGPFASELERRGIRWEAVPLGHYTRGAKAPAELLRYALRQPGLVARLTQLAGAAGAALIYANGPRVFPATALAARRLRVPLLWHLHLEVRSARDRRLIQLAARLGRPAVIACSRACLQPFPPRSMVRRTAEVVYNGVPPVELLFRPFAGETAPGPVVGPVIGPIIGVIGRIHPGKAQADLLRAAPGVLAAVPDARFRLIGPVDHEAYAHRLRELAAALGPGRVEFSGPLPSVTHALAGLDVLVVPSRREALGRVILEALSAGVPVVASDAGGIPEVIEPGHNGLLFSCGDAGELARALVRVLSDRALRDSLIRGGRESYRRRWRVERFQREMLERIARQIGRRPPHLSLPAR